MMKQVTLLIVVSLLLAACATAPVSMPAMTSTPMPTSTPTWTPKPTTIPTATSTPTPVPPTATPTLYRVSVYAFHDYNGNGVPDDGEPPLNRINSSIDRQSCTTGDDGTCEFLLLPGKYILTITPPADSYFTYLCISGEEEIPLSRGIPLIVDDDMSLLQALLEGPYRNPFRLGQLLVTNWTDLDEGYCCGQFPDRNCEHISDWLGGRNSYDGHTGTDFEFGPGGGGEIHPMRSGVVYMVRHLGEREGYEILIRDEKPYGNQYSYQAFVHLSSVNVREGQRVTPDTILGAGAAEVGGVHIGIYYGVPRDVHPLSPNCSCGEQNPYTIDPFAKRLWTGIQTFGTLLEKLDDGTIRQIYP